MKTAVGLIAAGAWVAFLVRPAWTVQGQTVEPLPFSNLGGATASQLQTIAAASSPVYSSTVVEERFFRGAFTPSSANTRLAIQSDDGSDVSINGVRIVSRKGDPTHWEDTGGSLEILNYAFTAKGEYCIEIAFQNKAHTAGDTDGVTLYAIDGGGSVRNGIAVWGPDQVCVNGSIGLNACGDVTLWQSNPPGLASIFGSGDSVTVQGLSPGIATITATDSHGKMGSRVIKIVRIGIQPSFLITCDGGPSTFVIDDAEVTSGVSWDPPGAVSANARTNTLTLSVGGNIGAPGTNYVTASWNGCSATATAVVVQVSSLFASTNPLCGGGQVIYTAHSNPSGYENYLVWSGEGLRGTGSRRTNNYTTPGVKTVSVTCGFSTASANVTVHKVHITNAIQYGLAGSSTPVNYYLSSDSVGPFSWSVQPPGGPSASGSGLIGSVLPGNTPGTYTIRAFAMPLPECQDTSVLQVVQVTLTPGELALCEGSASNVTVTVNPPSALSLLTFDIVTSTSANGLNSQARIAVNGTNLTIYGDHAGTAYLRVRLASTAILGTTIQIVRVTFPPDPWYVGVGKSTDYPVTIIPPDASVTFDTASNAIATATAVSGGVRVSGVASGTTQVRARVGSGAVCSTRDLTSVRVEFAADSITLCNCHPDTVGVRIDPPGSPVNFEAVAATIAQVTAQGTNVTINPLTSGKATVTARLGTARLDEMQVKSVMVTFPSNDWFALRGQPQTFEVAIPPDVVASEVNVSISDSNIATLAVSLPLLTITGLTNGTAQITARIGTNQTCATKAVTIFSAQLKAIEFTSDHNLMCDGADVLTAGNRYPNVEWDPGAHPPVNAPMTHTAGTDTRVAATVTLALEGLPSGTSYSLAGVSREAALTFGGTNTSSVQALNPLGREIRTIDASVTWTLNVSGNALALGESGPHQIFTTLGAPSIPADLMNAIPNVPRMKIAVERVANAVASASGAPDAYTCTPRIVWDVVNSSGGYNLKTNLAGVRVWLLPSIPADCDTIARFTKYVCLMEGVPGRIGQGTFMALYRTATEPNRPNIATNGTLNNSSNTAAGVYPGTHGTPLTTGLDQGWWLALADGNCAKFGEEKDPSKPKGEVGCHGGLNAFEAAVVHQDLAGKLWFFPAGVSGQPHYDSIHSIVQIFRSMVWVGFGDHDNDPATEPEPVVKAVEYRYTRQDDVNLCPP